MRPLMRPDPILPVQGMETYEIISPVQTHTRPATCAEVDCPAHLNGWITKIDSATELGRKQLNYIRLHSGREFADVTPIGTTVVELLFNAGQECFAEHRVPLDRPALFLKRGGDWRARTYEPIRMRSVDWVDDFANHQESIVDRQRRG